MTDRTEKELTDLLSKFKAKFADPEEATILFFAYIGSEDVKEMGLTGICDLFPTHEVAEIVSKIRQVIPEYAI